MSSAVVVFDPACRIPLSVLCEGLPDLKAHRRRDEFEALAGYSDRPIMVMPDGLLMLFRERGYVPHESAAPAGAVCDQCGCQALRTVATDGPHLPPQNFCERHWEEWQGWYDEQVDAAS